MGKINQFGECSMSALFNQFLNSDIAVYVIGVLGIGFGFLISWKELWRIFSMFFVPSSEIAHLRADERAQIIGQAQSMGSNIQSPITKKPCVVWQLEILERRRSGRSSRWVTVYKNFSSVAFNVSDGTGRIRLEPQHNNMELVLHDDVRKSSNLFSGLEGDVEGTLNELGINTKGLIGNKSMKVNERYVEQGEELYVIGKVVNKAGVMTMDETVPLIVSDHGKFRLILSYMGKVVGSMIMFGITAVVLYYFFMNIELFK